MAAKSKKASAAASASASTRVEPAASLSLPEAAPSPTPPAVAAAPPSPVRPPMVAAEVPTDAPAGAVPSSYDELAEFGRENFSALIKAQLALSDGFGAIGKELMGYARTSLETASQTATALLNAKTIDEVVTLSTRLARANVDAALERATKLSELGVAVANEAMAPIGGRVEAAIARLKRPVAA
jgi:hypothetical protein